MAFTIFSGYVGDVLGKLRAGFRMTLGQFRSLFRGILGYVFTKPSPQSPVEEIIDGSEIGPTGHCVDKSVLSQTHSSQSCYCTRCLRRVD